MQIKVYKGSIYWLAEIYRSGDDVMAESSQILFVSAADSKIEAITKVKQQYKLAGQPAVDEEALIEIIQWDGTDE